MDKVAEMTVIVTDCQPRNRGGKNSKLETHLGNKLFRPMGIPIIRIPL